MKMAVTMKLGMDRVCSVRISKTKDTLKNEMFCIVKI